MRRPDNPSIVFIFTSAALIVAMLIAAVCLTAFAAGQRGMEAARLTDRLLAMPQIKAAPGFTTDIVVPPGDLYDPLQMVPHGDEVWVNDDGGESAKGGGRLVAVDILGQVTVLPSPEKMLPDVGMDVATENFGPFGGQLFLLTQPSKARRACGPTILFNAGIPKPAAWSCSARCRLPAPPVMASRERDRRYGSDRSRARSAAEFSRSPPRITWFTRPPKTGSARPSPTSVIWGCRLN